MNGKLALEFCHLLASGSRLLPAIWRTQQGRDMIRLSDNQPAIVTNAAQILPVEKPRGQRSMFGFGESRTSMSAFRE
jgi:hypothetical protein